MEDAFTSRLSDYLDDEEIDARERAAIEEHLAVCGACRQTLAELEDVKASAAALPATRPAEDLWPGIASRITREPRVAPFASRAPRRITFTIPQLLAASIALMVLSGGMVWMMRLDRGDSPASPATGIRPRSVALDVVPANFADPQYDAAVADLERTLQAGRGRLDPETIRVLEANLQAIDRAIEQSRQALERDPANLFLNAHLAAARQRKLALLRRASALAIPESAG